MIRTHENKLSIYPISAGNELNVFATQAIDHVRIISLQGEPMGEHQCPHTRHCILDIRSLPAGTYFAEVTIDEQRPLRYAFVKL